MLLRSSSTPILNSWLHQAKSPHSESDQCHHLQRTKSLSLTASFHPPDDSAKKLTQKSLQSEPADPRARNPVPKSCRIKEVRDQDLDPASDSIQRLFSSSGLGLKVQNHAAERRDECVLQTLVVGGGMGGDGGRVCGGGGGGRGSDGGGGGFNNNHHGSNSTDAYYQRMIEANPDNALLLGNYARFLKEVHGDFAKAEEFCARAILADPNDANVLSLYADLIWHAHKDAQRAENYFDQAIKTSPDDCYVLASYARFLWDTDVEEEDDKAEESRSSPPGFSHGTPHHSPLAAAS